MSQTSVTEMAGPTTAQPPSHHHSHDHAHGHDQDHPHSHGAEGHGFIPLGPNPVLDIGGDMGALLVYLPASTATGELHVRPVGNPTGQFHVGVHRRKVAGAHTWVALFYEIVEGTYELLDDDGAPRAPVAITGGRLVELDLR